MASKVASLCCNVKLSSALVSNDSGGANGSVNAKDCSCAPSRPYVRDCRRALEDPENFWAETAARLTWYRKWDRVLDLSRRTRTKWQVDFDANFNVKYDRESGKLTRRRHCHGRELRVHKPRRGSRIVGPEYGDAYQLALEQPDAFWPDVADKLVWDRKWIRVIDDYRRPFTKWFPGGEISVCYNAVDRHVDAGKGDNVAIIYDSPVTNVVTKITYKELKEQVSRVAGVLKKWGIRKGDRVVIYMPMIPETIYAMLACSRIGAIHSLVFGGFAAKELAADACLSANFGIEPKRTVPYKAILDEAINISEYKPKKCLIFLRPGQASCDRALFPSSHLAFLKCRETIYPDTGAYPSNVKGRHQKK
ncbi:hypothetical protein HPB50_024705 [Hyalomma asiaticum]|uniref:Uncharacterized protein n=1 Tax=Hyalomma asiaticum TaxID=266040 RepID=A0ACB7SSE2_HYAAI|nr:hypothetical protein HPB50_024705 [Hyalomma asiaticum]